LPVADPADLNDLTDFSVSGAAIVPFNGRFPIEIHFDE
jgi:hypothetical protein